MSKMSKFTDIGQFRNVVHNIRKKTEYAGKDENGDAIYNTIEEGGYPTIKFLATEKLHGTNASVVFSNDEIYAQSRTRILGRNSDNAGFASFVMNTKEVWEKVQQTFKAIINDNDKFIIYGEWCGGSIQKGMGINKLEKMFVIFAMKIVSSNPDIEPYYIQVTENDFHEPIFKDNRIFNITTFPTKSIEIDFNHADKALETMNEWIIEIENESGVAKHFGIKNGLGEGWVCCSYNSQGIRTYIFKIKGEKHAVGGGKSKKIKIAENIDPKIQIKMEKFVNEHACKEHRLDQAFYDVNDMINKKQPEMKNMGLYLKAVSKDIMKEEEDILSELGIEWKLVNKAIMNIAKKYYVERLNKEMGL